MQGMHYDGQNGGMRANYAWGITACALRTGLSRSAGTAGKAKPPQKQPTQTSTLVPVADEQMNMA
jgi:hypothetical protein